VFLGQLNNEPVAVKKVRNVKETNVLHLRKLSHPNIIKFKSVLFSCYKFYFLGRPLSCKLKGRPFVIVVVRRLSVTYVLWLNGAR